MRDVDHLFRDDSGSGEFVLGDELAGGAGAQDAARRAMRREPVRRDVAVVLRLHRAAGNRGIAAPRDPALADRGEAGGQIDARVGVGIGPRGVVDADRRLQGIAEFDLAERHSEVRMLLGRRVDLVRAPDRAGRDAGGRARNLDLGVFVHGRPPLRPDSSNEGEGEPRPTSSLRRHDPDQVQRVRLPPSQPHRAPLECRQIWVLGDGVSMRAAGSVVGQFEFPFLAGRGMAGLGDGNRGTDIRAASSREIGRRSRLFPT